MNKKPLWIDRGTINGYVLEKTSLLKEAAALNILPSILTILKKRNIKNIEKYLYDKDYTISPELLYGACKGIELIATAINDNQLITVIGDYDVDGATASSIMSEGIKDCNGNTLVLIPNRLIDGYGISNRLIDIAYSKGSKFIITVDNGIAAYEQIEYAKSLGFTIVITDHHEVPFQMDNNTKKYIIPNADAVIDPKLPYCKYPFKSICGAMIAFKMVCLLFDYFNLPPEFKEKRISIYTELAGVGTIGDIMPLLDENRSIVSKAINFMKHGSSVPGIRQLIKTCNIEPSSLSSYSLGFIICPCINAEGRLEGEVNDSIRLLTCNTEEDALPISIYLNELNEERKKECFIAEKKAMELLEDNELAEKKVTMLYIPGILESVCGIVAGRVKDKLGKPCIVVTDSSTSDVLKGSGRSVPGYNLYEQLNIHKHLCIKAGGHDMAAGISIHKNKFIKLDQELNESANTMDALIFDANSMKIIDLYMPMKHINERFVNELSLMEPFGKDNEKPTICNEHICLYKIELLGSKNNALKLFFVDGGKKITAVFFGDISDFREKLEAYFDKGTIDALYKNSMCSIYVDVLYYPSFNTWNGNTTIQFIISDIRRS